MSGKVWSYLTFPGIMLHEISHLVFIWIVGVKVHRVRLFRLDGGGGDVTYDQPDSYIEIFLISFAPLVINSLISYFLFDYVLASYTLQQYMFWIYVWIAFCAAYYALPSVKDAHSLLEYAKSQKSLLGLVFYILSAPLYFLFVILNALRQYHLQVIWAGLIFILAYWGDKITFL